jgi:hypothetical protein
MVTVVALLALEEHALTGWDGGSRAQARSGDHWHGLARSRRRWVS